MKWTLGALLLLPLMVPLAIQAQEAPQVRPGDRVRVTAPECHLKRQKGTLISLDQNLVLATVGNEDIECPIGDLTRLEVSVGERKWWKAGLFGAGIPVVAGLVVAKSVQTPEGDNYLVSLIATAILTPVGFLVGSLIGARGGPDKWRKVPLPLTQSYLAPSLDGHLGLGIGLSVHFRR